MFVWFGRARFTRELNRASTERRRKEAEMIVDGTGRGEGKGGGGEGQVGQKIMNERT